MINSFELDFALNDLSSLSKTFDPVQSNIYIKDKNLSFIWTNKLQANSCGFTNAKDIAGLNDYDICSEETAYTLQETDRTLLSLRKSIQLIEEGTFQNKYHLTAQTFKFPIIAKNGELLGLFGISQDITALKKLESHPFHKMQKSRLSKQESYCLFYYTIGKSCREISLHLNISSRTVESYLENIKNKLICHSKSELIEKSLILFFNLTPNQLSIPK
jgi:DNA-binding CsgD family transcriptional regulator